MSAGSLTHLFQNIVSIISKLTGTTEAEAADDPILDPITGFLALFANIDLGNLISSLGSGVIELLNPQNRDFYLGLTGMEIAEPSLPEPRRPIDGGAVIRSAPLPVGEGTAPTPPEETGPLTYQTPEEIVERLQEIKATPVKTTVKRKPMTNEESVTVIDEQAVIGAMNQVTLFHSAMTIVMSIVAVVAEIATLGQLDEVLPAIQSCYALLDTSGQYFAAQSARTDVAFERPYRYWLESQLVNNVPPPADLGRFLARETITGDDYSATMRFWGFSDFWSEKYRKSRFIELPAETIFKAYHYGELGKTEGVTAEEDVLRLLRIADYNPEQVPLLNELAYDYPNRTELRLMARRSSIPEELVASALATSGLRPEYQPFLIETLENWDVDSIRGARITESLGQFERGFIQSEKLGELLVESDASPSEAENYQLLATLRRDGRRKQDRTKTVRNAFRHGLLLPTEEYHAEFAKYLPDLVIAEATEADVYRALMIDLGYDAIDIELMLDDDRIRSKNIEVIESLDELLSLMEERE